MNDEKFGTLVMMVDPVYTKDKKDDDKKIENGFIMPREMHPSRDDFEELGFVFRDIPGDDVLCYASLPDGWSIRPTDQPTWSEIVDEDGVSRGDMFYRNSLYDRDAHMKLWHRYGIRRDSIGKETEVYFGNATEKLFVSGRVTIDFDLSKEEVQEQFDKLNELIMITKKFADEVYPDWENVHAYWNDNKKVKTLKR